MDYIKGVTTRRSRLGVEVVRVHYTADPSAIPNGPSANDESTVRKLPGIVSRRLFMRVGSGELLFAEILNRYADMIIIRDPDVEIPPTWKRLAGFDHGKTNPTAALVVAIDYDGRVYCLCEYYQPGLTPSQHMPNLYRLPGFMNATQILADPSIFHATTGTSRRRFKSIADL